MAETSFQQPISGWLQRLITQNVLQDMQARMPTVAPAALPATLPAATAAAPLSPAYAMQQNLAPVGPPHSPGVLSPAMPGVTPMAGPSDLPPSPMAETQAQMLARLMNNMPSVRDQANIVIKVPMEGQDQSLPEGQVDAQAPMAKVTPGGDTASSEVAAPAASVGGQRASEQAQGISGSSSGFNIPPEYLPFLMRAGAELMQPMPLWQSSAGHFGRAAMAGMDAMTQAKVAEREGRLKEAQIDQAKAQTPLVNAQTEGTKADTEKTKQVTAKLLQELQDEKALFGLKKEDLEVKIESARKEGLLTDARAKALKQELKTQPAYQAAIVRELNARAKYYENGGSGSGGGGSGMTAVEKNVLARSNILTQQGMDPIAARMQAWQEVGMGAGGQKNLAMEKQAQNMAKLWQKRYALDTKSGAFSGTLEEYAAEKASEISMEQGSRGPVADAALSLILGVDQEGAPAQPSGTVPAPAQSAAPVPTKMVDGKRVFDRDKIKPGVPYLFPDGSTRTWDGK